MHKKCTPSEEPKTYNLKFNEIKKEVIKKPKKEVTWKQLLQHMKDLSKNK